MDKNDDTKLFYIFMFQVNKLVSIKHVNVFLCWKLKHVDVQMLLCFT